MTTGWIQALWDLPLRAPLVAIPSIVVALMLGGVVGAGLGARSLFFPGGRLPVFVSLAAVAAVWLLCGVTLRRACSGHGAAVWAVCSSIVLFGATLIIGSCVHWKQLRRSKTAPKDFAEREPGCQRPTLPAHWLFAVLGFISTVALATLVSPWLATWAGGDRVALIALGGFAVVVLLETFIREETRPSWLDWPPGLSVCALAAVATVIVDIIGARLPTMGIVAVVVFVLLIGSPPKHRYPLHRSLESCRPKLASAAAAPAGEDWEDVPLEQTGHAMPQAGGKQPLVIVCVSGGGIRAAAWACHVLQQLESDDGSRFSRHVRLIFGASGGMLGAAHYVHTLLRGGPQAVALPRFMQGVEKDGLSWLVQRLVFGDMAWACLPFRPPRNRGDAFEAQWEKNLGFGSPFRLADCREKEREGSLPSLVFSPMMVEDGRRLLFSNLDLSALVQSSGLEIKQGAAPAVLPFSQGALEASRLFESHASLPVMTLVRASATFPFIMPISSIPTDPRRRVVDAGYYDNYGTSLACAWLDATLSDRRRSQWLKDRCSGVMVVQIRDGVLNLTRPLGEVTEPSPSRVAEQLVGPFSALFGFRNAVQLFENDEDLAKVIERLEAFGVKATTVSFEFGGVAPLSWALSEQDKRVLAGYARSEKIRSRVRAAREWLK